MAFALRQAFREGYGLADLRADALAGLVVGVVALPLSMALAVASGVPPQQGLYTALVAGVVTALLGGSRVQVSGPTAAFVILLAPVSARYGLQGLLLATVMAGGLLVLMGLARMGRLIEFVPYPVTTGFTAGIAVVIATLQAKDFLGLQVAGNPQHFVERVRALAAALPSASVWDAAIGLLTLALLLAWPRVTSKVPAPLVALALAAAVAAVCAARWPGFEVATIGSRFGQPGPDGHWIAGIPRQLPLPAWPWAAPGATGVPSALSLGLLRALLPSAFAIAMLGAIESLLSAVVADGLTGRKHDPDAELIAQGAGNLLAPFFGGFAATGALARTATNVRAGARSPLAAVAHSLFVLASLLALAPLLRFLPMASLAALLLLVAWHMSERRHVRYVLQRAPRSDVLVLLACFTLTVLFDMVVAVTAGMVLSSLLFIRRMAEVSGVTLVGKSHPHLSGPLPPGLVLYDVAGPLFFGAAQSALSALETVDRSGLRVLVLDVTDVPAIDATGLVNLESLVDRLNREGVKVVVGGVQEQPLRAFVRAGWRNRKGRLRIFRDMGRALANARAFAATPAP